MPQIIITKKVSVEKGLVPGVMWPKGTIRQISQQMGNDTWYKLSDDVNKSIREQAMLNATKRRTAKRPPAEVADAEQIDKKLTETETVLPKED